jgi:hypothetical protein
MTLKDQGKKLEEKNPLTKTQAFGVGGVAAAIATVTAFTGFFMTQNEGKNLMLRIEQNAVAIQDMKKEIDQGFLNNRMHTERQFDRLRDMFTLVSQDRWTKADHDRFSREINSRFERIEFRLDRIQKRNQGE